MGLESRFLITVSSPQKFPQTESEPCLCYRAISEVATPLAVLLPRELLVTVELLDPNVANATPRATSPSSSTIVVVERVIGVCDNPAPEESTKSNERSLSARVFPRTGTLTVFTVSPGANRTVPLRAR